MAPPHTVRLTGRAGLWALVTRHAQCSDSSLDPDQWFPVSADPGQARQEAAAAIAICTTCPVRGHCLRLSLLHWDIGQHGVWGGPGRRRPGATAPPCSRRPASWLRGHRRPGC